MEKLKDCSLYVRTRFFENAIIDSKNQINFNVRFCNFVATQPL